MSLKRQFVNSFTTSRRHPKTEAALEVIIQRSDETLREYINRFNREAIQVLCADHMKRYLLERGFLMGTEFRKIVGIEPPRSFNALLKKARPYMDYEEKVTTNNARDSWNREPTNVSRHNDTGASLRTREKKREEKPCDPCEHI